MIKRLLSGLFKSASEKFLALSGFALGGKVLFVQRDYSACYSFECPHVPHIQNDKTNPPCPLGHPVRVTKVTKPWAVQPEWRNTVVTKAIDCIISLIVDNVLTYDLRPTYMAAGTSAGATTDSMATLVAEVASAGRVVAGRYKAGQVGSFYKQAIITGFFGPTDANANLQEFGLMAGGATSTFNSGSLLARVLSPYGNKDNTKTITVVWTITGSG